LRETCVDDFTETCSDTMAKWKVKALLCSGIHVSW
jgi:hypothetical protein